MIRSPSRREKYKWNMDWLLKIATIVWFRWRKNSNPCRWTNATIWNWSLITVLAGWRWWMAMISRSMWRAPLQVSQSISATRCEWSWTSKIWTAILWVQRWPSWTSVTIRRETKPKIRWYRSSWSLGGTPQKGNSKPVSTIRSCEIFYEHKMCKNYHI